MLAKVLGKTGAPIKAQEMMYMALVQAVILYGSEIWVAMDVTMTVLEGFQHRISRRIVGMTVRRGDGGEWEWVSVDTALEVTWIFPTREYVRRRQGKNQSMLQGGLSTSHVHVRRGRRDTLGS